MNKPIGLRIADIYLRFPEIMEEECNDLADFLEQEHIVYEGATDIFIEKDKEIERLNRIIDNIFNFMQNKYDNSDLTGFTISFMELQDLRKLKEGNKDE